MIFYPFIAMLQSPCVILKIVFKFRWNERKLNEIVEHITAITTQRNRIVFIALAMLNVQYKFRRGNEMKITWHKVGIGF